MNPLQYQDLYQAPAVTDVAVSLLEDLHLLTRRGCRERESEREALRIRPGLCETLQHTSTLPISSTKAERNYGNFFYHV